MDIRDRIKEFRRVPAAELVADPRNWRDHPPAQREALQGVLQDVGFADAVLARELPDGRLMLIDGHLRAEEVDPATEVPCLVLDVTEAEAAKILLTHDPLASMAEANASALDDLLSQSEFSHEGVTSMLANLAAEASAAVAGADQEGSSGGGGDSDGPGLGSPAVAFNLVFDDSEQLDTWYAFLKSLRERYPDAKTAGERLTQFIGEYSDANG